MINKGNILIIDDDKYIVKMLKTFLMDMGYRVDTAHNGEEGLEKLFMMDHTDVVFLDQIMPGISGLETHKKIRENQPDAQVIIITAYGDPQDAFSASSQGVFEYLEKPVSKAQLEIVVTRAMGVARLNQENRRLKLALNNSSDMQGIVTNNKIMKELLSKVAAIARFESTVMITGEHGTGKELFATSIHKSSARAGKAFVTVNCSSFTEELLGNALFGVEQGANGEATHGCFDAAMGGTLFLDEVAYLGPKLQSRLLRVIQDKEFCAIGSQTPTNADFRLICASTVSLEESVKYGDFREDLYYRINVVPIHLPPMRERTGDIPLLVLHFLDKHNKSMDKNVGPCSPATMDMLRNHSWQGNCRELENVFEHIIAVKQSGVIETHDLPEYIRTGSSMIIRGEGKEDFMKPYNEAKHVFEKQYLINAISLCDGNIVKTSQMTHIPRSNLYGKLRKHGLR